MTENLSSLGATIHHDLPNTLCEAAARSLDIENAGGNSQLSEAYSMDLFCTSYNATDIVYEKEVQYWIDYKMVDYVCLVRGERIGVSVTRAMGFPDDTSFHYLDAERLLEKKVYGLVIARNAVCKKHRFFKSILHIWCQTSRIAVMIETAFHKLVLSSSSSMTSPLSGLKGTLELMTTICADDRLYRNKRDQ